MSHNITIEGGKSVRLKTAGKFCDRDIVVTAEGGEGGDGYALYDAQMNPTKDTSISTYHNVRLVFGHAQIIGDSAFSEFSGLVSVSGEVVTSIGEHAFQSCKNLTSIDFPSVVSVGFCAFEDAPLRSVSLPKVTNLDDGVFRDCMLIASVDLPNVETIGSSAFVDCYSLKNIHLPKATSIGYFAFGIEDEIATPQLNSANFPSATSIGTQAFYGQKSFDTLILSNTETVCALNLTALLNTKIAGADGMPTGEGFIYVPSAFYEQYMANLAEQAYALLIYSGYSEAEAEYMAPYIISAILRTIEGSAQATTFGLRNPLANFHGFTQEAIEQFKANYKVKEQ